MNEKMQIESSPQPDVSQRASRGMSLADRFLSLSLSAKFLVSILGTTGLAMVIFGVFVLIRNQQSQAFWSNELQSTVQQQSSQQIINTAQVQAENADQALSKITLIVKQLANYRGSLYSVSGLLSQGSYWDGTKNLMRLSDGQYGNSTSEPASVFLPNTVTLNQDVISDLDGSMYLDFQAPAALQENSQIIGLYYISANNSSVYYPNIDLAHSTSPDFNLLDQIFYTIATPQNDPQHAAVWTPPYQDPAGTGLIVTASVPVYDQNDQFRGVMSADVQLSKISSQISDVKFGKTGFAFLIDPQGHIVSMPPAGYSLFGIQPEAVAVGESPKTTLIGMGSADLQNVIRRMTAGENGVDTIAIQDTQFYVAYAPLPTIGYSIGLIAPTAELDAAYLAAQQKIGSETRFSTILSIAIILILLLAAAGVSVLVSRFLSSPLAQLTQVASEVSRGNLNVKADVRTLDEIGTLAETFNNMTSQIRNLVGTLEQRVTERTHSLELAAEVGRSVSQVRVLEDMLNEAAELIRRQFDLYYVQIYLTNPAQNSLVLHSGTGSVGKELTGRGHHLPIDGSSINGRAAVEKRPVVIANTAASASFRPNPLLPDTRSEMAVPLLVGDKVVGVLDMQSRQAGALNQEILPAFEALAGQFAIAIQNASLLAETEQTRAEVEAQARRLARTNWDEYLDAIHEPEQVGYVFEQNQVMPLTETDSSQPSAGAGILSTPISIVGEELGNLAVELGEQEQNDQTRNLLDNVARQVAQQIENLRLLQSAERYRSEAEQAARRTTREGWKEYIESSSNERLDYLYDLKSVQPVPSEAQIDGNLAVNLPLKVRDETIGKLSVLGMEANDQEAIELANAVAERLSLHIESLRQYDRTQSALTQSEKLFDASSRLTQAADLQELVKSVIDTLGIPDVNRALLGIFDYGASSEVLGLTVTANWWNGSGQEVTPVGTRYSADMLQVLPQFISPMPVFYNDAENDPRVDASTREMVYRLNLRAVAVLPLHSGGRQIGALILEAETPHDFTPIETRLFTALAPQLATVLENRRQFERAQKQAEREAMLNAISQKIQGATTVEAVLQIAARELGHALGAPLTIAQLGVKENGNGRK